MANIDTFKRICYLRPEKNFPIDYVIVNDLCTHIILAFVSIDHESSIDYDDNFAHFTAMCRHKIDFYQSKIKLMFSIGGGGVGGWKMASSTDAYRERFVNSILNFIEKYQLDGVDIDWEFPGWPNKLQQYSERNDFIELLREIRFAFDKYYGKKLLLSIAVAAQYAIIKTSYSKPEEINNLIDFINLMTYDYYIYKWYWPYVGHNSPLFHSSIILSKLFFNFNFLKTFSIEWSAEYWLRLGISRNKIMIGIPTYGKRYTLFHERFNFPGSIAIASHDDMSYGEVCEFLNLNGTVQKYDQIAHSPYAYNGRQWVSYENELSVSNKAKWIKMSRFGGVMIFSLNADKYRQHIYNNNNQESSSCSSSSSILLFPLHLSIRDTIIIDDTINY